MYPFDDNHVASVILSLSVILITGFLMTRITKKLRLPNVTGYICAGVLIGPHVLHFVPAQLISEMDFVTDATLGFISFGVGKYFKLTKLKNNGRKAFHITILEALLTIVFITAAMRLVFQLPLPFCFLLGVIGSATSPASTLMSIRQYRAKGSFVDTLLEVIALDNAVALIAFSICASVVQAMLTGGRLDLQVVAVPVVMNLIALLLGIAAAFLLRRVIHERRSNDHRLVLVIAIILALTGLCSAARISPLLSCMLLGATYINISNNKSLFKQVDRIMPPLLLFFFVLSGMRLNLPAILGASLMGLVFLTVRITGKYIGAFLGAKSAGCDAALQKYMGLALIPSASVSIGLATLGSRILPDEMGSLLTTIVVFAGLICEVIGPASAKASLFLSGAIKEERSKKEEQAEPAAGLTAITADITSQAFLKKKQA